MKNLRGEKYKIDDTGEYVEINQLYAKKLRSHNRYDEDYLRSFCKIPEIIKSAIYIGKEDNLKNKKHFSGYKYYLSSLKIGDRDYVVRISIAKENGNWYYEHTLTNKEGRLD